MREKEKILVWERMKIWRGFVVRECWGRRRRSWVVKRRDSASSQSVSPSGLGVYATDVANDCIRGVREGPTG